MKKCMVVLTVCLLAQATALAQGVDVLPRQIIDKPTGSILPSGSFDLGLRFFGDGGVIMGLNVGVSKRFMFGASYGGFNVLGDNEPNWNPAPAVLARYQIINENVVLPAITLGFESQGFGTYADSTSRFQYKSPGFYAVASKSYNLLERIDFHGGINVSLENNDGDSDPNLFLGMVLAVNPYLEFLTEYDLAFNDDKKEEQAGATRTLGDGKGYMNAGLRLNLENVVYMEVFVKNLFDNQRQVERFTREIKITYFQFIKIL